MGGFGECVLCFAWDLICALNLQLPKPYFKLEAEKESGITNLGKKIDICPNGKTVFSPRSRCISTESLQALNTV